MLALLFAANGLARRTTWYLASDQYAFLTFAGDLAEGRVLHDPRGVELVLGDTRPSEPTDALFQTYLYDEGRLYSRYPPGFPVLLALAGLVGGEPAQHLLNPAAYLLLLLVVALLAHRLAGLGAAGAGAAAAAVWGVLVVPAEMHYWGITVARDLPAHLLALSALVALLGGHTTIAGLAIGLACSIRPDAVLYGISLGALMLAAKPSRAALAGMGLAFLVGLAPLLAYNTYTGGHPFAFTQGFEFRQLFGFPSVAEAAVAAVPAASGGGFRLTHLPDTLPVNLRYLAGAFGGLLVPALGALAWATVQRHVLALALVPYMLVATVFYGCWGHGDPRYLVGISLGLVIAMAVGATWWSARLARISWIWRVVAIAATIVVPLGAEYLLPEGQSGSTTKLVVVLATATAAVGCVGLVPAAAGLVTHLAPLVPAMALAVVGVSRFATGSNQRDPFQQDQVVRARAAINALVPPGSLVLTTPALGRPAENLSHYASVQAVYLGELDHLGLTPGGVSFRAMQAYRRVFILTGPLGAPQMLGLRTQEVARRGGSELYDWFVDPQRARGGAFLYEVQIAPRPAS